MTVEEKLSEAENTDDPKKLRVKMIELDGLIGIMNKSEYSIFQGLCQKMREVKEQAFGLLR